MLSTEARDDFMDVGAVVYDKFSGGLLLPYLDVCNKYRLLVLLWTESCLDGRLGFLPSHSLSRGTGLKG
jgi:hypothetical protein